MNHSMETTAMTQNDDNCCTSGVTDKMNFLDVSTRSKVGSMHEDKTRGKSSKTSKDKNKETKKKDKKEKKDKTTTAKSSSSPKKDAKKKTSKKGSKKFKSKDEESDDSSDDSSAMSDHSKVDTVDLEGCEIVKETMRKKNDDTSDSVDGDDKNYVVEDERVVDQQTEVQEGFIIKRETIVKVLVSSTKGAKKEPKPLDQCEWVPQPRRKPTSKQFFEGQDPRQIVHEDYSRDCPRKRIILSKRDSTPTQRFPEGGYEEPYVIDRKQEVYIKETVLKRPQPVVVVIELEPPKPESPKPVKNPDVKYVYNQKMRRMDGASRTKAFKLNEKPQDEVVMVKESSFNFEKLKPLEDKSEVRRLRPCNEDGKLKYLAPEQSKDSEQA